MLACRCLVWWSLEARHVTAAHLTISKLSTSQLISELSAWMEHASSYVVLVEWVHIHIWEESIFLIILQFLVGIELCLSKGALKGTMGDQLHLWRLVAVCAHYLLANSYLCTIHTCWSSHHLVLESHRWPLHTRTTTLRVLIPLDSLLVGIDIGHLRQTGTLILQKATHIDIWFFLTLRPLAFLVHLLACLPAHDPFLVPVSVWFVSTLTFSAS